MIAMSIRSLVSIGGEVKVASDTGPEIDLDDFVADNISLAALNLALIIFLAKLIDLIFILGKLQFQLM